MNGKHPIDELFARHLRDAEAQPPRAVWEGIVRERAKARPAGAQSRGRWGLAAILLLLLGAAGYWTLVHEKTGFPDGQASVQPSPSGEGRSVTATPGHTTTESAPPTSENPATETPATDQTKAATQQTKQENSSSEAGQAPAAKQANTTGKNPSEAVTERTSSTPPARSTVHSRKPAVNYPALTASSIKEPQGDNAHGDIRPNTGSGKEDASTSRPSRDAGDESSAGNPMTKGDEGDVLDQPRSDATTEASHEVIMRVTPDVHLPVLSGLVTPFMNNAAPVPGPILQGDSTPAYVLSKGRWWIAAQGELAMLKGEWKGTGPEVKDLNTSETWRDGQGLSLVIGREWLSGWSVGLGVGATKQRSRFLRRETEPGETEMVIDTTWTSTPMGTATNYTWDIVQTQITEPGVEHDYTATNTYTKLRISPEVSYQLLRKKRFGLCVRLAPIMMFDVGRKGNTIVPVAPADSLETTSAATSVLQLNDASLDDRFPMSLAISAGLEFRYRICERFSVSALPMFTYWMPRTEGRVPSLMMNELGGALRLRYDLRHQERRSR